MKKQISVRTLVSSAILIAMNIVLTRLLSYDIGPVRIGMGFIPIALGGMFYGPVTGAIIAVVADVLGAILQGKGFWIGFSLSALLMGASYGLFLYGREKSYRNITICVVLQAVLIDALLGALWHNLFAGNPYVGALIARSVDAAVMIPVKIILIRYLWKYVGSRLTKYIQN